MKRLMFVMASIAAITLGFGCGGPKNAAQPSTKEVSETSAPETSAARVEKAKTALEQAEPQYPAGSFARSVTEEALELLLTTPEDPAKLEGSRTKSQDVFKRLRGNLDKVQKSVDEKLVKDQRAVIDRFETDVDASYAIVNDSLRDLNSAAPNPEERAKDLERLLGLQRSISDDINAIAAGAQQIASNLKAQADALVDEEAKTELENLCKSFLGELEDILDSYKDDIAQTLTAAAVAACSAWCPALTPLFIAAGAVLNKAIQRFIDWILDLLRKWGKSGNGEGDFPKPPILNSQNPNIKRSPAARDGEVEIDFVGPTVDGEFFAVAPTIKGQGYYELDDIRLPNVPGLARAYEEAVSYSVQFEEGRLLALTFTALEDGAKRTFRFTSDDDGANWNYIPE